ncbi:MAG: sigma-70 family RNA polymerase sigma factor [Solirubrobacterales bacterium]|nr:sigma-70 family RNA polymerase sigma factor [Solirubrobacterales bacterium]
MRAVYRAYGRLVYAVAFKVLADPSLSEEATQQTFVKAWRAARSFDPSRELAPWLATTARRVAIDLHRRETLRRADPLDQVAPDHSALVTMPACPDTLFDIWEVRRAVFALPADEQQIVRLQHLEGLTHSQIATRPRLTAGDREITVLPGAQTPLRGSRPPAPHGEMSQSANRTATRPRREQARATRRLK